MGEKIEGKAQKLYCLNRQSTQKTERSTGSNATKRSRLGLKTSTKDLATGTSSSVGEDVRWGVLSI